MNLLQLTAFRDMPRVLMAVGLVFLAAPLLSLGFGPPSSGLAALAVLVGPFAVAATIFLRSKLALPVFFAESLLLCGGALAEWQAAASPVSAAGVVCSVLMIAFGALAVERDDVAPYLTRQARQWRRTARFYANRKIVLIEPETGMRHPAVLQDCSFSGVGLSINEQSTRRLMEGMKSTKRGIVDLSVGGAAVEGRLIWSAASDEIVNIGMAVDDRVALSKLVEICKPDAADQQRATSIRVPAGARPWLATAWLASIIVAIYANAIANAGR